MSGYTKLVMGGYLEGSMHPFSKDKSFGKGCHSNINRAPPISSKKLFESSFFVYYKVKGKRRGLYKYSSSEKNKSKKGILGCESILVAASLNWKSNYPWCGVVFFTSNRS